MLSREEIARLIPHAGAMVLLDSVVESDDRAILCRVESHRRADNPLRRDGRLHAIAGAEYGAQAAAVHGPLRAGGDAVAGPGMVVSVRELTWRRRFLDTVPGPIDVRATALLADSRQLAYRFELTAAGESLVSGEIGIILS